MNFYNYQRSKSFTDLCPGCLRLSTFILLQNCWSDWNQITCRATVGWGNESLFMEFGSNDQDIRHGHVWFRPFANFFICNIGDSDSTRFIQMVTISWHWSILNRKRKQLISKFKYWKIELWKYKVQFLSAKGLRLQKQTCSPTWALVSVVVHGPFVTDNPLYMALWRHSDKNSEAITKSYLYNFDPLKPHLYSKTGVYRGIHYFSYFCSKHRLWVLVRTASPRRF